MNHFATEGWIDFSNQMVPASGQRAAEKDLEEGCKRRTQTVSRWQRPGPLFHISEIRRSARMGFLEKVALSPKRDRRKGQKAVSLIQLLLELAITLFIAGVAVPSLLRSAVARNDGLAGGSLHTINIAGVTFFYLYKNVGFAALGALVGAAAAFAIASPTTTPKSTTSKQSRNTGQRWRSQLRRQVRVENYRIHCIDSCYGSRYSL